MISRTKLVAVACLLIVSHPALASIGSDWRDAPDQVKLNYINGIITGILVGLSISLPPSSIVDPDNIAMVDYITTHKTDMKYTLDRFYEDPRNVDADMVGAVIYCYKLMNNQPGLETFLKNIRKRAN